MDCDRADTAMMQYMDGKIKPADASALAKHLLVCEECRERFMIFEAAVEKTDQAADGTFALTDAPEGFTEAVMEKVRTLPAYLPAVRANRADIIVRVACGLCAILLGFGLGIMYNQEAFTAFLSAYPRLSALLHTMGQAWQSLSLSLAQLLVSSDQAGQQLATLLAGAGNMSLLFVIVPAAALFVMLRGEKVKA